MNPVRMLVTSFSTVCEVASFFDALSEHVETAKGAGGADAKELARTHMLKIPESLRHAKVLLVDSQCDGCTHPDAHAERKTLCRLVLHSPQEGPAGEPSPTTATGLIIQCYWICWRRLPIFPATCIWFCLDRGAGTEITIRG